MAGIHESGLAVLPFGNVRGCNEPGISELKFVAYIKWTKHCYFVAGCKKESSCKWMTLSQCKNLSSFYIAKTRAVF